MQALYATFAYQDAHDLLERTLPEFCQMIADNYLWVAVIIVVE